MAKQTILTSGDLLRNEGLAAWTFLMGSKIEGDYRNMDADNFVQEVASGAVEDTLSKFITAMSVKLRMVQLSMLHIDDLATFVNQVAIQLEDCFEPDMAEESMHAEINLMLEKTSIDCP